MPPAFPTINPSGPWGCTGGSRRPVTARSRSEMMHMRMGDGRWEMGSGDGDAGRRSARPSVDSRPTLLRFFDISPPPPRMHGTTADVEGWLLAAALAGVTRAFLSPWRHHALLRDAPRPGRRPGAKSRGRDRGQLDSPLWRAGVGIPFTWCLREFDGAMVPPQSLAALGQGCQPGSDGVPPVVRRRSAAVGRPKCGTPFLAATRSSPPRSSATFFACGCQSFSSSLCVDEDLQLSR